MEQIKNIIFDLGGVLLDVDYDKAANAFRQLGFSNFDELYSQYTANDLFEHLETGKITEEGFYAALHKYSDRQFDPQDIQNAWNSMLLEFRTDSLSFLESLKGKYRLFLLSNTNSIHHKAFEQIFREQTGRNSLDDYFEKSYYSHVMGHRKPYPDTYNFVLNDAQLKREHTLFIDDSVNNIEGAAAVGLKTWLLKKDQKIEDLFDHHLTSSNSM